MDLSRTLNTISIAAIPLLFAITVHEVAHGRVARHFGDRTAESLGRLSLNPISHVDPIGTILVPVFLLLVGSPFLFGWAKPVPVNPRNLRHPKADMAWVAAAGPAANLVMAAVWTALGGLALHGAFGAGAFGAWVGAMAEVGRWANILLAVFNMLPIPPLDGGRVLAGILPPRPASALARIEPFGLWIVLALLYTRVLGFLIGPVAGRLDALLAHLVS
jgi:Zn-dependent protease